MNVAHKSYKVFNSNDVLFFLIFDFVSIFIWWCAKETRNRRKVVEESRMMTSYHQFQRVREGIEKPKLKALQSNHKWFYRQKAKAEEKNQMHLIET